ncbi:uncharacterized protein C8Q71DRAFT_331765 [Rhodofomes roseus]|uniref:Yeast cell wall synthesis Kre9/Knh1-like N-terminal domain-containing protein n=1 Tax=Rhodofomes roseus TaxID=34475 RepID=A0ABQ8KU03_9APHY|nr:uncharacterized protein C8Q71DRAFT_331765 [Rhodofomes roseus]KAH9841483.1 hypothetical protein C8Q71DRAFT_331765 [Rhodofomes roseus]
MMFGKLFAFAASAALALAAPASFIPIADDIILWSADIQSPNVFSVWPVGSTQTIKWDPSQVPQTAANHTGIVLLGYYEDDSENLDTQTPLVAGFQIADGQVDITVPNVTERNDYIVVLFGNSGNASPTFTIKQ